MRNALRDRHDLVIGTRGTAQPKSVCTLKEWSKGLERYSLNGLYGKVPLCQWGTFFRLQVNETVGILLVVVYLTIIPRARMGSESMAHEVKGRMGY